MYSRRHVLAIGSLLISTLLVGSTHAQKSETPEVAKLASEVKGLGWICFSARTSKSDWDLFVMRPDGSQWRNLTETPEYNEGMPRFSADGKRMLYRRIPSDQQFDNNLHGTQGELILADRDGSNPRALGRAGQFPWASWMPDGESIVFLEPKGIRSLNIETGKVSELGKRHGIFQQMRVAPDGQSVCGVSNAFGASWSVVRVAIVPSKANAVSSVDCCTPDWFPDSQQVVFSGRPAEWTQLWKANADGGDKTLLYAQDGRHIYGGCASPDGAHVIFTGNQHEDGDPQNSGAPMNLMRVADAPLIGGDSPELRKKYPAAATGPLLNLPSGWEPHWTLSLPDDPFDFDE